MKKIFTLLFCTALISSAFAQEDRHDWRNTNNSFDNRGREDNHRDGREWNNGYNNRDHDQYRRGDNDRNWSRFHVNFIVYRNNEYPLDQRDQLIAQISSDYDYQVQQVIDNCELSPRDKRYEIEDLQAQRAQAVNNIYAQCGNEAGFQIQFNPFRRHRDNDDR